MCPLLKPNHYEDNQSIYTEGDPIEEIIFIIHGSAAFILPSFNNIAYINISKGNYFGEIDITGSAQTKNFDQKDWYFNKSLIYRHFSVRS